MVQASSDRGDDTGDGAASSTARARSIGSARDDVQVGEVGHEHGSAVVPGESRVPAAHSPAGPAHLERRLPDDDRRFPRTQAREVRRSNSVSAVTASSSSVCGLATISTWRRAGSSGVGSSGWNGLLRMVRSSPDSTSETTRARARVARSGRPSSAAPCVLERRSSRRLSRERAQPLERLAVRRAAPMCRRRAARGAARWPVAPGTARRRAALPPRYARRGEHGRHAGGGARKVLPPRPSTAPASPAHRVRRRRRRPSCSLPCRPRATSSPATVGARALDIHGSHCCKTQRHEGLLLASCLRA